MGEEKQKSIYHCDHCDKYRKKKRDEMREKVKDKSSVDSSRIEVVVVVLVVVSDGGSRVVRISNLQTKNIGTR